MMVGDPRDLAFPISFLIVLNLHRSRLMFACFGNLHDAQGYQSRSFQLHNNIDVPGTIHVYSREIWIHGCMIQ